MTRLSGNWSRFRAILVTVALVVVANIAISYASNKSGVTVMPDAPRPKSGVTVMPDAPRPKSGVTVMPDAPRPKSGVTVMPDAPRP